MEEAPQPLVVVVVVVVLQQLVSKHDLLGRDQLLEEQDHWACSTCQPFLPEEEL